MLARKTIELRDDSWARIARREKEVVLSSMKGLLEEKFTFTPFNLFISVDGQRVVSWVDGPTVAMVNEFMQLQVVSEVMHQRWDYPQRAYSTEVVQMAVLAMKDWELYNSNSPLVVLDYALSLLEGMNLSMPKGTAVLTRIIAAKDGSKGTAVWNV